MSRTGRAQDALYDMLHGFESPQGVWNPGPLHDMPLKQFSTLSDNIIEVLGGILCGPTPHELASRSSS